MVIPKLHLHKLLSSFLLKVCVVFFLSVGFAKPAAAQYYLYDDKYYDNPFLFEVGASLGVMNSLTDVGGRRGKGTRGVKDFNLKNTKLSGSLYASIGYQNWFSARIDATVGAVKGFDSILENVKKSNAVGRYNRNLNFRSRIAEITLTGEFHPVIFLAYFNEDNFPPNLSPYVIAGVGVFHFNPQAYYNGNWIDLKPLHTEGQGFAEYPGRKNYPLTQINFPLGIGFRYELTRFLNVRIEGIFRKLNTDYLDDVSTRYIQPELFSKYLNGANLNNALILNNRGRADAPPEATTAQPGGIRGNPNNADHYMTLNLKLGFVMGREKVVNSPRKSNQQKCPQLF